MQLVALALSFPSLPSLLLPFKLLLSPPPPLLSLSTCRDVSVIGTTTLSLAGLKDQELKDIVLKLKMRCDADIFCHHFRSTEHSFMTIASHLSFLLSHSLSLSLSVLSLSLSVVSSLSPSLHRYPNGDFKPSDASILVSGLFQYSKVAPIRNKISQVQDKLRAVEKELATLKTGKDPGPSG